MEVKQPLTEAQQRVLDAIKGHIQTHGYPPTQTEIAAHFSFSVNAARDYLLVLQRKGVIRVTPKIARGIVVL